MSAGEVVAPEDEELTLRTGGMILGGWQSVRVTRGVERLPSDFVIEMTERYPGQANDTVATPGDTCEVWLGQDKILTGYIERYCPTIDADDHKVSVSGRSLCCDLVDCSVQYGLWSLVVPTLSMAAKVICDPFKIAVSLPDGDADLSTVKAFSVLPGYTAYALLEEVARSVAVLVWDDAEGRLVLSKVGRTKVSTALVLGDGGNVKRASVTKSVDQRFSDYIVVAQSSQPVTPAEPSGYANIIMVEHDPEITRYRPRVIQLEYDSPDHAIAAQRARWEGSRRYGRSLMMQVTVTGWRDGDGKLWSPNTRVTVDMPALKVSREEMVIAEVTWQRGDQGTEAVLTLIRPEGLSPEPITIQPAFRGAELGAPNDNGQNRTGGSSLTPSVAAPAAAPRAPERATDI